jgi:hypothetical protein
VKQVLRQFIGSLGYHVEGTRYTPEHLLRPECLRTLKFDDIVCRCMFRHGQERTFIQVGAYDGITADPVRRYIERCGWRGVMVRSPVRLRNFVNFTRIIRTLSYSKLPSTASAESVRFKR